MDHSTTPMRSSHTGGLASYGALLPGVGIAGTYTTANGHASIQSAGEKEGEGEEGRAGDSSNANDKESSSEPRLFRIESVGNSELSTSVGPVVNKPIIRIQSDSDSSSVEGSPLFPRMNPTEKQRQQELAQASLPPLLRQTPAGQDSPLQQRMGSSVGNYGAIPVSVQAEADTPSPSRRRKMRKTISGEFLRRYPHFREKREQHMKVV